MKTVYLAKYKKCEAAVLEMELLKDTGKSLVFSGKGKYLIGWFYISDRPLKSTLKQEGIGVFDTLSECFGYINSRVSSDLKDLDEDRKEMVLQLELTGLVNAKPESVIDELKKINAR